MPFLIALAIALPLTPALGWLAPKLGLVDHPVDRFLKIHERPIPIVGGIAAMSAAMLAVWFSGSWISVGAVIALVIALAIGLTDDVADLSVWIRISVLAAAGAIAYLGTPELSHIGVAGVVAAVLLVLACVNALNIIDGQDGLAGGLASVASAALWGLLAITNSPGDGMAIALSGGIVGFLFWNRPPARVFLGDGGAYGVGLLLAFFTMLVIEELGWQGILAAGTVLAIFAFELTFTVTRRVVGKKPLARGDRLHSYDIVALRSTRIRSTLLFWGAAIGAAGAGLLAGQGSMNVAIAMGVLVYAALAAWGVWLWIRRESTVT